MVTCVDCGHGVPREKTDITERGERCDRCIKARQIEANRRDFKRSERQSPPRLSDRTLRSDKPFDRMIDKIIDVLGVLFHSIDED
jgi:hypothetical protein